MSKLSPARFSKVYALVLKPSRCVPLNPNHGCRDDSKHPTPVVHGFRAEGKDGEVVIACRLDVPRRQKNVIAGELWLSQERQNSRFFEDGAQRECRHCSDPRLYCCIMSVYLRKYRRKETW